MLVRHFVRKIGVMVGAACVVLSTSTVFASGFQSFEQNVSGLGNAYGGAGSMATDASIEFDNPAGMVRLKRPELSVSGILLAATAHFVGQKSTSMTQGKDITHLYGQKNSTDPLGTNLLPAVHLVIPINKRFYFGFGITVPFGLQTSYGNNNIARYFGTESQIKTFNFNPSLGVKVTQKLSVGIGLDAQYLTAELDSQFDPSSMLMGMTAVNRDFTFHNTAGGWGYGWNAGLMYQFTPKTRVGFSYRSQIRHSISGKLKVYPSGSSFSQQELNQLREHGVRDGRISSVMTLPDDYLLSLYQEINNHWAVMTSIMYTHWDTFHTLRLHFNTGLPDAVVHENFRNTWKYALGVSYRVNSKWLLRAGGAYDRSPLTNANRTIALPDADRYWISMGLRYQFTQNCSIDIAYSHVFIENGRIDQHDTSPVNTGYGSVSGYYHHNYADLFGLQVNYSF